MSFFKKLSHHGVLGSTRKFLQILQRISKKTYYKLRCLNAPVYINPTSDQLADIERELLASNILIENYTPLPELFKTFKAESWFPSDYHGGQYSGVWDEKLLEHWLSSQRLGLMNYTREDIFVDVAACESPWAKILRERLGIAAFAIDLDNANNAYRDFSFYRIENATQSSFEDKSVSGIALHCAYEMFMGEDDTKLIVEAARILKPGGKMIILPLYMHTHYCAYVSPESYGKRYSDFLAKEYVQPNMTGIVSSRNYDVSNLKRRVLDPILALGMKYRLLALRNKHQLGEDIYCHFILEVER